MGSIIKGTFNKLLDSEHGPRHWINANLEDYIDAYWGSRKARDALPEKASEMDHFSNWDAVVPIDHGYDESKPESSLSIEDMKGAALFRGGELLSESMENGNWKTKLELRQARQGRSVFRTGLESSSFTG